MKNNISQMTTTNTPTAPYPFYEVYHNQIAKWPYVLDGITNAICEVLSSHWAIGEDLGLYVDNGRSRMMSNHKILMDNYDNFFNR